MLGEYFCDMVACDCKGKFPNFAYKPHGHVHTGDLDLIENIPLRNLEKLHRVINVSWPIYTGMLSKA